MATTLASAPGLAKGLAACPACHRHSPLLLKTSSFKILKITCKFPAKLVLLLILCVVTKCQEDTVANQGICLNKVLAGIDPLLQAKGTSTHCQLSSTDAVSTAPAVEFVQKTIRLQPLKRGCHVITKKIYDAVPELKQFQIGIANIFVMHTSASLTVNENASPDVPLDMEDALNRIVPVGDHFRHLDEGYDDMPAHVKASMMGSSLTIPISSGRFNLGTWQGIWLNEHRDYGGPRTICITLYGTKRPFFN